MRTCITRFSGEVTQIFTTGKLIAISSWPTARRGLRQLAAHARSTASWLAGIFDIQPADVLPGAKRLGWHVLTAWHSSKLLPGNHNRSQYNLVALHIELQCLCTSRTRTCNPRVNEVTLIFTTGNINSVIPLSKQCRGTSDPGNGSSVAAASERPLSFTRRSNPSLHHRQFLISRKPASYDSKIGTQRTAGGSISYGTCQLSRLK